MSYDQNPYSASNVSDGFSQQQTPVDVPDYLIWTIIETICCCQPLGIAGIVFSILANSAKSSGDYAKAVQNAKYAKICLIVGVIGGLVIGLLYIAMVAFIGVGEAMSQQ
jgi:hypothetical protein